MRINSLVLVPLLSLVAATLSGQRQFNVTTPEGRLLRQIDNESDDAKRVALMDQFLAQFPKHEGVHWVYTQMVTSCAKLGQSDTVLAAAEKVLAEDPADLETAYAAVKAAEAKKDPDTVRKWAVQSSDLARKVAQAPKGGEEDDNAYKQRIDAAKNLDTYTEYALFTSALQVAGAGKKVELLKTLEDRAPESTYLAQQGYGVYFLALVQSGDTPGAVAVAEKVIAKGQGSDEMLATAAEFYLRQNREPQKVLDYSSKLIEVVSAKTKPELVSDADWQKRKNHLLGWAQWMTGVTYCTQNKFAEANKALRAAVPLLEGDDEYLAGAFFNLGIANSHLKNFPDAAKFFEQCAGGKSPYQPACAENLKGIRARNRAK